MSCLKMYNSSYWSYFRYFTEVSIVDVVTTVTAFQKWPAPQKFVRPPIRLLRNEQEIEVVACGDLQFQNLIKILTVCLDWKKGEGDRCISPLFMVLLYKHSANYIINVESQRGPLC
jgi:hypothetical protein